MEENGQVTNASLYQCKKKALSNCAVQREEGMKDSQYYTKCKAFALIDGSVAKFTQPAEEDEEDEEDEDLLEEGEEDRASF